jgi:hypothetical protein
MKNAEWQAIQPRGMVSLVFFGKDALLAGSRSPPADYGASDAWCAAVAPR